MAEMSMRKRVARAICCPGGRCEVAGAPYDPIKGQVGICAAHSFEKEADAAIAAMREPTKAMVTAADETFQPYWPEAAPFDVEWRAAIDAALLEERAA